VAWRKGKSLLLGAKGDFLTDHTKDTWVYLGEGAWARKNKEGMLPVNLNGKQQQEEPYQEVMHFSEGKAAARQNDKWGFINGYGKMVIAPQFDAVLPFRNGIGYASLNGKWGVLKQNGSWLVKPVGTHVETDPNGNRRLVMP